MGNTRKVLGIIMLILLLTACSREEAVEVSDFEYSLKSRGESYTLSYNVTITNNTKNEIKSISPQFKYTELQEVAKVQLVTIPPNESKTIGNVMTINLKDLNNNIVIEEDNEDLIIGFYVSQIASVKK